MFQTNATLKPLIKPLSALLCVNLPLGDAPSVANAALTPVVYGGKPSYNAGSPRSFALKPYCIFSIDSVSHSN
ncbi:hypothetical protein Nos7524_2076 [Nostoc sp. PCC 7524]|nr:hypothetical protein Nos7524_2076 [Nostoc sp. PCC 7524]